MGASSFHLFSRGVVRFSNVNQALAEDRILHPSDTRCHCPASCRPPGHTTSPSSSRSSRSSCWSWWCWWSCSSSSSPPAAGPPRTGRLTLPADRFPEPEGRARDLRLARSGEDELDLGSQLNDDGVTPHQLRGGLGKGGATGIGEGLVVHGEPVPVPVPILDLVTRSKDGGAPNEHRSPVGCVDLVIGLAKGKELD